MNGPIYNAAFLRGLAVTRLRLDALGRIIEAEGYGEGLRHWAYHCLYENINRFAEAAFIWEP